MPIRVNGEDRWEPYIPKHDMGYDENFDYDLFMNKTIDILISHISNNECQKIVRDFVSDYMYEYIGAPRLVEIYNDLIEAIEKEDDLVAQKDIL